MFASRKQVVHTGAPDQLADLKKALPTGCRPHTGAERLVAGFDYAKHLETETAPTKADEARMKSQ